MKKITIIFLISFIIIACGTQQKAIKKTPEVLPGFTLIPGPNALDKPGTIFAVDKDGVQQPLGYLTADVQSGIVQIGNASGSKVSSVGAIINFLGQGNTVVDINANADIKRTISYNLQLFDCVQERLNLLKLNDELEKTKDIILNFSRNNPNMADYKYYIITESVKSPKIIYTFDTDKKGDLGLKADIDKIVTVNPNVKWDNKNNFNLSYDLGVPLYVYAKYFSLNIVTQATGETRFSIGKALESTDPLYVKK